MDTPVPVAIPCRVLELMLYIKQPDAGSRGKQHDWEMHYQECLEANEPHKRSDDQRDRHIGEHRTRPRLPAMAHESDRQAVLQQKKIGRPNSEHDQWVPIKPIFQPPPT